MCTVFLSILWLRILENQQIRDQKCFVRYDQATDSHTMILNTAESVATDHDVSADFDFIVLNLCI